MQHAPRRTSGWPEGPRHASPGQASPQASVALGQPPQESPEPCRGETSFRGRTAHRRSSGLFRPVGALADVNGRPTQGGAPRRLGACPGLSSCAPLGLRAPNQSVEATATRALAWRTGPGDCRGVCGRRASPVRPKMVAPPHGEGHEAQRAQRTQGGVDAARRITVSVPICVPP